MIRKQNRLAILLFLAYVFVVLPAPSIAKTEIVYANYKYVMGDNDTKNDAKRICFIEAKRRCLEKVRTYVESETEVKNFRLTKDEIRTYAAALTKVEVVNEEIKFEGESIAIFMTVKAEVEPDHIEKQLARISKDRATQKKLKEQQKRLNELDKKYNKLKKQLTTAKSTEAIKLRKKRVEVFEEMSELEKRHHHIAKKIESRKSKHVELARNILTYIEIGMTPEDVKHILGSPDKTDSDWIKGKRRINSMEYSDIRIFFLNNYVDAIWLVRRYPSWELTLKDRGYNVLENGIIVEEIAYWCTRDKTWCRRDITKVVKEYVLGY